VLVRWWRRRSRGERGSFALELAVVAPALIALTAFVISIGRVAEGRSVAQGAARDAARAATINHAGGRNAYEAATAAQRSATGKLPCTMQLDNMPPVPEQRVTATVSCTVRTIWGKQRVVRSASSVTDTYRSTS
jgi:Flp pilus assembly protein TadG